MISVGFQDFHPYELYSELNEEAVHCKCIIGTEYDGAVYNVLRFGLPYFETVERVQIAVETIQSTLEKQLKVIRMHTSPKLEEVQTGEQLGSGLAIAA